MRLKLDSLPEDIALLQSDDPAEQLEAGAVALLLMAQWSLIAVHAYHVAHFEPRAAPRWRGENHLGLAARALTTLAMAAAMPSISSQGDARARPRRKAIIGPAPRSCHHRRHRRGRDW